MDRINYSIIKVTELTDAFGISVIYKDNAKYEYYVFNFRDLKFSTDNSGDLIIGADCDPIFMGPAKEDKKLSQEEVMEAGNKLFQQILDDFTLLLDQQVDIEDVLKNH